MERQLLLELHRGAVTDLYMQDNLVFSSSSDCTLAITRLSPPEFVYRVCSPSPINSFYVSNNEQCCVHIIIGGDESLSIYDWGYEQLARIEPNFNVTSVFANIEKSMIFVAGDDGSARIYDLSLTELAILRGHGGSVFAIEATSTHIFTCGADGKLIKWDFTGTAVKTAKFEHQIYDLCISQNGRFLACSRNDGIILLIDVQSGFKIIESVENACGTRFLQRVKMGLIENRQSIVSAAEATVRYYDVKTRTQQEINDPEVEKGVVFGIALRGTILVFGGTDGRIGVYDIE